MGQENGNKVRMCRPLLSQLCTYFTSCTKTNQLIEGVWPAGLCGPRFTPGTGLVSCEYILRLISRDDTEVSLVLSVICD